METRLAKLEVSVDYIQRDVHELKEDVRGLRSQMHNLEAQLHNLEIRQNNVRTTDFRILFGALITVALGLAGLMAKGFGWL